MVWLWSADLLVTEGILFFSAILFVYWVARALLLLTASEEEIDSVLDADVWWARRFWLTLRILLNLPMEYSA